MPRFAQGWARFLPAALRFIPAAELEARGYCRFLHLSRWGRRHRPLHRTPLPGRSTRGIPRCL